MLVLRPIVHQQQQAGRGQALDEAIEEGLCLGINPVQILEHQQQGLHLTFAQQHPLEPIERALAAMHRVQVHKGAVVRQGIQEPQQRREGVLERLVEGEHLSRDPGPDGAGVIAVVHMAVALQQVHDGEVGRRLAVGHRGALQHPPALGAVGVSRLYTRRDLPTPLPHQGDHLAMACLGPLQGLLERRQLVLPPHKGCQAPHGRGLQALAQPTCAHQLEDATGSSRPFTGTGPRAVTCTRPSTRRRVAAVRRLLPGVASCSMRARWVVSRPPSSPCAGRCRWPADHFPGVEPHAHAQLQAAGAAHVFGVGAHGGLHGQGGVAGAQGVVFVGNRRTKQGHESVAEHLIHRTLEAVHRGHHMMESWIEELLGSFGSRPRTSSVESLRSANSTVTCLRSPARAGRAMRILSVRWAACR